MNAKQHFEKHYAKLRFESWFLSLLCGLIFGFAAGFVAAFSTWFIRDFNGLWVSLAAILAVTVIVTPIFYFKKFRPTAMRNARRIDSLGLEERLVTMVEYENDETRIAQLQREDAIQTLAKVQSSSLKLRVSKKVLVQFAIFCVLGVGMTVVTTLSHFGIIPSAPEILETIFPSEEHIKYVSITYDCTDGGYIEGDIDQLIPLGSATEQVVAVADDGYVFAGWDDEFKKPIRSDSKVSEDIVYIAIFEPLGDQEGDQDGDGDPTEGDQDKPQDEPQEGQEGQPQEEDPNAPPSNQGGGKYEEANQIIDGETYYKEVIESFKELLTERLGKEGDQLSEEAKKIIEAYFKIV